MNKGKPSCVTLLSGVMSTTAILTLQYDMYKYTSSLRITMSIAIYPAIVERAGDGFSVFFPDLPGCTSAGSTIQQAALNAEEALAGHLLVTAQHGEQIADPSSLDRILPDADVEEVARILVRAERPGRSVRLNITLDEGLVAAIDRVAKNRSGFLAEAARRELAARDPTARGNF